MTARMMSGFGSHFASEAVAGALPQGRNSPQRPAFGLYAEQLSGTAFTAPRAENRRSWLYRMRPSAAHPPYRRYEGAALFAPGTSDDPLPPNRLRWDPLAFPDAPTDFVDGLVTMMANRDPADLEGVAVHVYRANADMADRYFYRAACAGCIGIGVHRTPQRLPWRQPIDDGPHVASHVEVPDRRGRARPSRDQSGSVSQPVPRHARRDRDQECR